MTKTAAKWVLPKDSVNPVFLDSPFGCRCLTLDSTTNDTNTPVTLESLEGVSPLSRGLYAISAATPCAMRIFNFSAFSFSSPCPFKSYTFFTAEFYSCYYICSDSNTVPNHRMAATLLNANRVLTCTHCLPYSTATTLRAGGGTRNVSLQRRFRSALFRSTLNIGLDVAPGIKYKYNRVQI